MTGDYPQELEGWPLESPSGMDLADMATGKFDWHGMKWRRVQWVPVGQVILTGSGGGGPKRRFHSGSRLSALQL